ncbi:MAG: acsD [Candidatus Brocadiaceae bacterium]|nr:acsD [Candidatus Brocadiaceae bacterium]
MEIPNLADKWTSGVNEVTLGATKEQGGSRQQSVYIGGAKSIPFMDFDGNPGHKPLIAMDVYDTPPDDWNEALTKPFADVINDPAMWAKKCVEQYGADLICLKLDGIHPDRGNKSTDDAVKVVKSVLAAVGVPLIIWGCEHDEKDNEVMPKVSDAARGEACLLGIVTQDNYKRYQHRKTDQHPCVGNGFSAEQDRDVSIDRRPRIWLGIHLFDPGA